MGATEALRDWQSGWGLLGGIAAMCCVETTDDRNKKSLFQVKLILSNIFFLAGTQGVEIFLEEVLLIHRRMMTSITVTRFSSLFAITPTTLTS